MQPYLSLFRDIVPGSPDFGAWKERRRSSNSSFASSHVDPESPLLPGWEAIEPKRNSRRAWLLALAIAGVLGLLLAVQGIERVAKLRDTLLLGGIVSSTDNQCSDPYLQPGFLWRSVNASMARWIPYDTTVSLEPEATEFRNIGGNYSIDDLPDNVLQRLPPSLSLALLDRPIVSGEDDKAPSELDFLRGKKVALVGCSLDRIAMISMCLTLGKGQADLVVDDHDFSSCYFKDLDLSIEVWFHGGVRQGTRVFGDDWYATQGFMKGYEFESRMESNYLWRARNSTSPDLIILASGTWDQVWLTSAFTPIEDLSAQTATIPERLTPVLPLQAYDYYRTRLRDMVRFLRAEFPDATVMFRPETYQIYRNSNAITYNIREAAIAAMRTVKVPIFSWGDKLNGEQDMIDPVHFRAGSAANWLYADLLLNYLRRHVEKREFCDA